MLSSHAHTLWDAKYSVKRKKNTHTYKKAKSKKYTHKHTTVCPPMRLFLTSQSINTLVLGFVDLIHAVFSGQQISRAHSTVIQEGDGSAV